MSYDNAPDLPGWQIFRVGQGILVENGRVLLSGNRWFTGKPLVWTLPGGRADAGEGVAEALVREFREETGLDVEPLELAYVVEARSLIRRRLFLTCAFTVRRVGGTMSCEADPAVEELRFVSASELGEYVPGASLGDPLRHYMANPGGSARYWFFPEYEASAT